MIPDFEWITEIDGSIRKYVRIKDPDNPNFGSFISTDNYRKRLKNPDTISHDHVIILSLEEVEQNIQAKTNIKAKTNTKGISVTQDSKIVINNPNSDLHVKTTIKTKTEIQPMSNAEQKPKVQSSIKNKSKSNDHPNSHNNSDAIVNNQVPVPAPIQVPVPVPAPILAPDHVPNFIIVRDFNAWQNDLIDQFGDRMPDSQLRLFHCHPDSFDHFFEDNHPDIFGLRFDHLFQLPVSDSNSHSWFDLKETLYRQPEPIVQFIGIDPQSWTKRIEYLESFEPTPFIKCNPSQLKNKAEIIKTNPRIILPTKTQKRILHVFFEAHRLMYNETVNFINGNKYFNGPDKGNYITDFKKLRDEYLKDKKEEISKKLEFELKPEEIDFTEFKKEVERKPDELLTEKQLARRKRNDAKTVEKNLTMNRVVTIPGRILDQAINKACAAFKSAITNLEKGHIKTFRIRSIKQSKKNKVFHLETNNFNKDGFFPTILGHMALKPLKHVNNVENKVENKVEDKVEEKNQDKVEDKVEGKIEDKVDDKVKKKRKFRVKNNDKPKIFYKDCEVYGDATIHYNFAKDRFTILFPETIKTSNDRNLNQDDKYIGLDAGIRTYLTGVSNDRIVEIGTNMSEMIKTDLTKLDEIKARPEIPDRIKKKYEKRINGKIERRIDDLHWKTIHYLITNFDHIMIGNLSTKSIVKRNEVIDNENAPNENKKKELSKMMKRIAMKMSFYKFIQRLKYKCQRHKINFQLINEYLTSKLCSSCGHYNDVGSAKIYECETCGLVIDRDVNAAKNIAMRGFYSEKEKPTKKVEKREKKKRENKKTKKKKKREKEK